MKSQLIVAIALGILLFFSCKKDDNELTAVSETLSMGSGYANDIYYNLNSGVVASVPRANWDIAFHTNMFSSTVLTNGASGVLLYEYLKGTDTTVWSTAIDTTGLYSKKVLYNSDTTWNLGAFERNMQGHPDYGWGAYSASNHDLLGTTLYVIKLANGTYKKILIVRKYSSQNKYVIRYANIDGTGEQRVTIDCSSYTAKGFVYFSLTSNNVIDREPESNSWDFVVTQYITMVPAPTGGYAPYPVVGILSNTMRLTTMGVVSYTGVRTAELTDVNVNTADYTKANFKTNISEIGWDWKTADRTTGKYTLKDSVAYFVKRTDESVYKIVFTAYEGSSTGVIKFDKTKVK